MKELAKNALSFARKLQAGTARPPTQATMPKKDWVVDSTLVMEQKHYIISVVEQINGTYREGYYDASAVMLRRLVETLIIEAYISKGKVTEIKNDNGDFLGLKDLIDRASNGKYLNLSRNSKVILRRLKKLGDLSAHNRTFIAKKSYFDSLCEDLFLDIQTLLRELINESKPEK